mgnify:CR=1 FL=1
MTTDGQKIFKLSKKSKFPAKSVNDYETVS